MAGTQKTPQLPIPVKTISLICLSREFTLWDSEALSHYSGGVNLCPLFSAACKAALLTCL